jgi:glyceraldehyde-3-phosphate dehydrogenase/erythrose-4-phosphate dehydrogenase
MIIAAVLSSAFKSEKIEIVTEKGIKPQNGIDVSHEKIGYVARSGDASDFDVAMCDLLGKAAVGSIINGESEKLLYAHNGEVQELSLDKKIDDRTLSIDEKNGADRAIYLQANQALGMGSKDGGLYGRNPQAKFDQVVDLYKAIRRSDWYNKMMHFDQYRNINLTPAQMKAVLWKLSTFQETDDWMWIRRIVRKIPEKQVAKLKAMAAEQGLGEALDLSLKDINGFVLAGNALIFRSGAFNMFIENKEAGVNIVGIRSLTGSKALSAKDIVNHNSYSNGVFNRYKIAGVRMFADKPATIDTLETPQLLIPPDYNRYRDELIEIPYFEAKTDKGGYDTEEILAAYEKAGISIDVMFDYGPGGEEGGKLQAKRLLPFAKRDIPLVLASPVNKDGVRAMLKDLGHENKNALVESLYSFNRSLVSHEVQAVDTLTCTSNAMLSIIMALATNDAIDIQNLYGKTWHSATSSNAIFPEPSGRARQPIDWLRGVSVLDNYVPAGTGAAKNLQVVIDSLENGNLVEQEMGERIQGLASKAVIDAVRTGTFAGSNYEIIFALNKPVTQQQVAGILRDFAKNRSDDVVQFYEGVPGESDTPLDLSKIVGMPEVSIIDGLQMKVSADGKMLVIAGYYDNQAAAPGQMLTRWGARMVDARRAQEAIALRPSAAHGVTGIASSREEVDAAYSKAAALPADAMSQLTDNDMEMLLWKMNDIYETHRIDSAQMREFRGIIGKLSFGQIKRLQDIAAGVRSEHDRLVFAQRNMTGILEHVLAMDPFDVIANADAPAIVREADANVYEQFKKGYSDVLNKVQGAGGALVIGAHVLENAGVISAIKTLKDVNKDLKVVVWANEYKNLNVLDATRLTGIVDKFSSRGLQDTIIMARQMNIEASRIMVINSPEDVGQKSAELDSVVKSAGVRAINLKAPYYKQVDGNKINAMPLVIGKAVTMIFSDKQEVVDAYMQMAQQYGGRISDAEMKQLIDLTEQLSEVPLFRVDDEIAAMQITYEDTLNKI